MSYDVDVMLSFKERLAVVYQRLRDAPPCASHDEAFALLCDVLTSVEDELSGVPNQVENHVNDGRMYPPQLDNKRLVDGRPELTRYRSKGHNVFVSDDGALLIMKTNGEIEFSKADAYGLEINL